MVSAVVEMIAVGLFCCSCSAVDVEITAVADKKSNVTSLGYLFKRDIPAIFLIFFIS